MQLSLSSSFVDPDAYALITGVVDSVRTGELPNTDISCIISTRELGDNAVTDRLLQQLSGEMSGIPIVCLSAKRMGRLREPNEEKKEQYDHALMEAIMRQSGGLPDVNMMLGDMVIKGPSWCERIPSLNLHPDIPLSMGGTDGIYWNVIGEWVEQGRRSVGGMVHLATPTLDAGSAVGYFQIPTIGTVDGIDFDELWSHLPTDPEVLKQLITEQTGLKANPDHELFKMLRTLEASYETQLVQATLRRLALGEIQIREGRVFGIDGLELKDGFDLTSEIVNANRIRQGKEGQLQGGSRVEKR